MINSQSCSIKYQKILNINIEFSFRLCSLSYPVSSNNCSILLLNIFLLMVFAPFVISWAYVNPLIGLWASQDEKGKSISWMVNLSNDTKSRSTEEQLFYFFHIKTSNIDRHVNSLVQHVTNEISPVNHITDGIFQSRKDWGSEIC